MVVLVTSKTGDTRDTMKMHARVILGVAFTGMCFEVLVGGTQSGQEDQD